MTGIEQKALALVNEIEREEGEKELTTRIMRGLIMDLALCRAIEQHEAFKQEVSDAAEQYNEAAAPMGWEGFDRFIIPKPKPDPLAEVLEEISGEGGFDNYDHYAYNLRAALEARGLEITSCK
jgi:hypothetical protein